MHSPHSVLFTDIQISKKHSNQLCHNFSVVTRFRYYLFRALKDSEGKIPLIMYTVLSKKFKNISMAVSMFEIAWTMKFSSGLSNRAQCSLIGLDVSYTL